MIRLFRSFSKKSNEFSDNFHSMTKMVSILKEKTNNVIYKQKNIKAANKHLTKGKLLVRDRIDRLLDKNAAFLELSPLAAHQNNINEYPSGGIVCGIGPINGVNCMIIGNDATVKGGTYYPITIKKHLRAQEIAVQNHLPCIYLVDSGGANLWYQEQIFPDKNHFGRLFFNQAQMSAKNIPQIAIVMGSCTAGGAYIPAMCDQCIIVKNQGSIFLAGPPLVKAATGEVATVENLGGAQMHCSKSGVADYLAENDINALKIARCLIFDTFSNSIQKQKFNRSFQFDYNEQFSDNIYNLISSNLRRQSDIRLLFEKICSKITEFKKNYGETLVCAFGQLYGQTIGLMGNNGVLLSESSLKGAHFIQLCTQKNIPLIFWQNITGFMVGEEVEQNGIAKHGAKLITAVACAPIPKITFIIGSSNGAGNYAMCGRAYSPNFLFMYPNAEISVMGSNQAQIVLNELNKDPQTSLNIAKKIQQEQTAIFSTMNLWDDGLIDPKDTKAILAMCLAIVLQQYKMLPNRNTFGVFRM